MKIHHDPDNPNASVVPYAVQRFRHPDHNPDLSEGERFALKTKGDEQYVQLGSTQTLTRNKEKARLFSGDYLNESVWDWSLYYEAVSLT